MTHRDPRKPMIRLFRKKIPGLEANFILQVTSACLLLPAVPHAETAEPALRAVRIQAGIAPRIDGWLSEEAWKQASAASDFRQREPVEGEPATEKTEIRVLYSDRSLFIGVTAEDREPGSVIGRILQRDQIITEGFDGSYQFGGDDIVAVLLDPFLDKRNAFVFATNPNGAEFDALITDESPLLNTDWRGLWIVAAARTPRGWSAEFEIPFRTLRYPERKEMEQSWGFNILRLIRRKNEQVLWSGWTRAGGGFHRVSAEGRLEGLAGLPRSGANLEMKPVGLLGAGWEAGSRVDLLSHAGLDMKLEVRPGLVLDATLNPDFAQVEADDEQVNLTRFDLFYPEKRDFFLENAGLFDFGTRGLFEPPPFLLFMSRSIGIKDEEEIPLAGGVRLTGRAGGQTVGLLNVATRAGAGEPPANHAVIRLKRDLWATNYIGVAVTDRRDRGHWNTAGGLDASFWPLRTVNVQCFAARTSTSGPGGDDSAHRLAVDYTGERFGCVAEHLVIGTEANAEMGFITRTGIRRISGNGRVTFRPRRAGLRRISLYGGGMRIASSSGVLQDKSLGTFVDLEFESGESLSLYSSDGSVRLDEAFDLGDRVPVPAGEFRMADCGAMWATSAKRPVALAGSFSDQQIFDGWMQVIEAQLALTPGQHVSLRLACTASRVRMPGGRFDSTVLSGRVVWALSTRLSFQILAQVNSLDREFLVNGRIHFIHHPGSDLFFVLNEERGGPGSSWTFGRRDLVFKLSYLVRI